MDHTSFISTVFQSRELYNFYKISRGKPMAWPLKWNLFDSICFSISHSIIFQFILESRLVTGSSHVSIKRNKAKPVWSFHQAGLSKDFSPKPSEEGVSYFVDGKLELKFIPWKMVHLNAKNAWSSTDSAYLPSFLKTPVSYTVSKETEEVQL